MSDQIFISLRLSLAKETTCGQFFGIRIIARLIGHLVGQGRRGGFVKSWWSEVAPNDGRHHLYENPYAKGYGIVVSPLGSSWQYLLISPMPLITCPEVAPSYSRGLFNGKNRHLPRSPGTNGRSESRGGHSTSFRTAPVGQL